MKLLVNMSVDALKAERFVFLLFNSFLESVLSSASVSGGGLVPSGVVESNCWCLLTMACRDCLLLSIIVSSSSSDSSSRSKILQE